MAIQKAKSVLLAATVFATVLGSPAVLSQSNGEAYLDGRPILELASAGRYEEAYDLARKQPERYAQWGALLIWHRLLPQTSSYSSVEAVIRGYGEACRYRGVNKESEAFCYRGIIDVRGWEDARVPGIAELVRQVSLPNLSAREAQEELNRLEAQGVPYAMVYNRAIRWTYSPDPKVRARAMDEAVVRPIAERYPYSLGGTFSAGWWAGVILWSQGRYEQALRLAQPSAGILALSGSVVAWAEYAGAGVKQNKNNACTRAHFWTRKSITPAGVYTLGMCYLEGDGGFPKDPVEAYALFWLGNERYPGPLFAQRLRELEATLSPEQIARGRQRVANYLR
ncbi:hypothetical protein [Thermus scotoductus]|uniref:hypothetical protein n=2 Tax=Thermus scotoductus TaxID=37636 RepID=UPI000F7DD425|nr:hypothetical protein [Thermus scotoductus]